MLVLTINAGGSSVRLDVYERKSGDCKKVKSKHAEADADPEKELHDITTDASASVSSSSSSSFIAAVFHRLVHGGRGFTQPTVITASVQSQLESLVALDPLHNPPALRWIAAARAALPSALQVANFDTNFFSSLPPSAQLLSLPSAWLDKLRLRRYGFHGMAHHDMWRTFAARRPDLKKGGRLITLQLGSGCSATATLEGRPIDTSMGFGPLGGLIMTTRCGDVDPAALMYVQRMERISAQEMETALYQQSGLLALSRGESKDMRALLQSHSAEAAVAVDMFCIACVKYIGAYAALLGGLDGIAFGGGIGEKGTEVRRRVCDRLAWMGVVLDGEANAKGEGTRRISQREGSDGKGRDVVDVWVVSVDEAKVMIEEGQHLLDSQGKEDNRPSNKYD